jgi:hypothetical protein
MTIYELWFLPLIFLKHFLTLFLLKYFIKLTDHFNFKILPFNFNFSLKFICLASFILYLNHPFFIYYSIIYMALRFKK